MLIIRVKCTLNGTVAFIQHLQINVSNVSLKFVHLLTGPQFGIVTVKGALWSSCELTKLLFTFGVSHQNTLSLYVKIVKTVLAKMCIAPPPACWCTCMHTTNKTGTGL